MKKKRFIIFIGEWKSEYAFFQEFLKNKFTLDDGDIKSSILYSYKWNFILFWHPRMWTSHKGWDSQLMKPDTYKFLNLRIQWSTHSVWNIHDLDIIYLFFTDTDTWKSQQKVKKAEAYIKMYCKEYAWEILPILARKEIETWFICWIWEEFTKNYPELNKKNLEEFLNTKNVEEENNTKELLSKVILKNTEIGWWWKEETIWRAFWKYIDVNLAKHYSSSFKAFIDILEKIII